MKNLTRYLTAAALCLLMFSCKSVSTESYFYIIPYTQTETAGKIEKLTLDNIIVYGIYDPAIYEKIKNYKVSEYIYSIIDLDSTATVLEIEKLKTDFVSRAQSDTSLVIGPVKRNELVLVAHNFRDKVYAWRTAETYESLESVTIQMVFPLSQNLSTPKYHSKWFFLSYGEKEDEGEDGGEDGGEEGEDGGEDPA